MGCLCSSLDNEAEEMMTHPSSFIKPSLEDNGIQDHGHSIDKSSKINPTPDTYGPLNAQISNHTSQGNISAIVEGEQTEQAPDHWLKVNLKKFYPRRFRTSEGVSTPAEVRGQMLHEGPVKTNGFQLDKRKLGYEQLRGKDNPSSEGSPDIWRRAPDGDQVNDPEVRAVVRIDPDGNNTLLGVIYRPQGETKFKRALMQPMEREDRQNVRRFMDHKQRRDTWPERGRDGLEYARMERAHIR